MKSALPKVLQPLAGRPLLAHVIDTARSLEAAAIHVVYGHGGERVREALTAERVDWTLQAQQLGTGHAVLQAIPKVADDHVALILYGDVPLLGRQTLMSLVALAGPRQVALLTMTDPILPEIGFPTTLLIEHPGAAALEADAFERRWATGKPCKAVS